MSYYINTAKSVYKGHLSITETFSDPVAVRFIEVSLYNN